MNKDKLLQQLRNELESLTPDTHFKRGYAHAIIDVDHFKDEPTPAIEWKPINKDEMVIGKHYLIWGKDYDSPITGVKVDTTTVIRASRGGHHLYNATHYAEFNKPEGVE